MRISDWSSDVCSSDLRQAAAAAETARLRAEEKMIQVEIRLCDREDKAECAAKKKAEKALEVETRKKERETKKQQLEETRGGKKRLRERSEAPEALEESNLHTCHYPMCISQWNGDTK